MLVSVVLVASCRANTLPFLVLPFAAWFINRDRRILWAAVAAAVLVLGWTLFAIKYTVYPEGAAREGMQGKLLGYLIHPDRFFNPLFETLSRAHMRQFLGWSFVGILGWLTVALPAWTYPLIGVLLLMILVLGVSRDVLRTFPWVRLLVVGAAVSATLLAFLALLVQWPQAEEGVINGVQGRYLLIPALAVAYALSGASGWMPALRYRTAMALVTVVMGIGLFTAIGTLIGRYYLDPVRTQQGLLSRARNRCRRSACREISLSRSILTKHSGQRRDFSRAWASIWQPTLAIIRGGPYCACALSTAALPITQSISLASPTIPMLSFCSTAEPT